MAETTAEGFSFSDNSDFMKEMKKLMTDTQTMIKTLSKSHKVIVESLSTFSRYREEDFRSKSQENNKEDKFRDAMMEAYETDILYNKEIIKGFENLIEETKKNGAWFKANFNSLQQEIAPLAKATDREYTKAKREFSDKNLGNSLLNEVIKEVPLLGMIMGKSASGPTSHDTFMRKGFSDLYQTYQKGFDEQRNSIIDNRILTPEQKEAYEGAKRRKARSERGRELYRSEGFRHEEEEPPRQGKRQQPRDERGRFLPYNQGETSDIFRRRTNDDSESFVRSLPAEFGGPALFLARRMEDILGSRDEQEGKGSGSSGGPGLIDDMIQGGMVASGGFIKNLLPKIGMFLTAAFAPEVIIPIMLGAGAFALIAATVSDTFKRNQEASNIQTANGISKSDLMKKYDDTASLEDTKVEAYLKNSSKSGISLSDAKRASDTSMTSSSATSATSEANLRITKELMAKSPWSIDGFKSTLKKNGDGSFSYGGVVIPKDQEADVLAKAKNSSIGSMFGDNDPMFKSLQNLYNDKSASKMQFHTGGMVPGPQSMEVPSVLLGGERVLSHDQNDKIEKLLQNMIDGQKTLINEMKKNTKATEDKDMTVSMPSSFPTRVKSNIGSH